MDAIARGDRWKPCEVAETDLHNVIKAGWPLHHERKPEAQLGRSATGRQDESRSGMLKRQSNEQMLNHFFSFVAFMPRTAKAAIPSSLSCSYLEKSGSSNVSSLVSESAMRTFIAVRRSFGLPLFNNLIQYS